MRFIQANPDPVFYRVQIGIAGRLVSEVKTGSTPIFILYLQSTIIYVNVYYEIDESTGCAVTRPQAKTSRRRTFFTSNVTPYYAT